MSNIMFLTHRMSMGFGVAVVVEELSKRLVSMGHYVCIGTLIADYEFPNVEIFVVNPDPNQIAMLAEQRNIDVIIAHTTPYFEVLPSLTERFKCWAWEHGDPSYEFFPEDGQERAIIAKNKQIHVYPKIQGVIAISEFIRKDIKWPNSYVIYNGADHLRNVGKKTYADTIRSEDMPLKIGTLMRLGEGESLYKGNQLYLELCEEIKKNNLNVEIYVMGRGTEKDAEIFEKKGYKVYCNASDEERENYLRSLDIFISPSLWEGFNLPLVEAMKSGTLSMAFDTGAHPEVCPFVYSSVSEMVTSIKRYAGNRQMLLRDSERCYDYVNKKFTWEHTTSSLLKLLFERGQLSHNTNPIPLVPIPAQVISKPESLFKKGMRSIKNNGIKVTVRKVVGYFGRKL